MFKKMFLFLIAGMFVLGMSKLSFAMSCGEHSWHQQIAQAHSGHEHNAQAEEGVVLTGAVNVGNKICPVTGEKVNQELKATYEHEGKVYNFCCAMCVDVFKNDPQKYIKIINDELKQESAAEEGAEGK